MASNICKYGIIGVICMLISVSSYAQHTDRDYLRSGNRLYRDSTYTKAEVDYRKALELNGRSSQAYFNLGNALLRQQKPKEAMEAYEQVVKVETNKRRLASAYHNMGVILQSQKQFGPAIECYKNALRRNPSDNETRYNLVLCQHLLKNSPQQEQQGGKDNKDGKDKSKEEDQNSQKQDRQKQDKKEEQQKEQQQQADRKEENMSKENAEQLLNAAMQDEKETQERIRKAMAKPQRRKLEKQW